MQLVSEEPPIINSRAFLTLKYCHKVLETRDHIKYNTFFINQNTLPNEYVEKVDPNGQNWYSYAGEITSCEKTIHIGMLETDFGK